MELRTLGRLELEGLDFSRPKLLLLLAYLALEGPRERRFLAELFWPEADQPMASLRVALAQLRKGAPGTISGDRQQLSSTAATDAVRLLDKLERGELTEALRLYQGPFLAGIHLQTWSAELEEWVLATRELIADRVRKALLQKAARDASAGDFAAAADRAEQAWQLAGAPYPTFEELRSMHLFLCAAGNARAAEVQKEALTFGVTLDSDRAAARDKLAGAQPAKDHDLPLRASSFIGREPELLTLAQLLSRRDTRLVTLCGPGGVGKTRLAVQIAYSEHRNGLWPDGVSFVALEQLSDPAHIPAAIAEALDIELAGQDQPLTELTQVIGKREMLLILDNFEQLTAGNTAVSRLLLSCPGLVLLITSRERLNLDGEHLFTLDGLPVPAATEPEDAAQHDAVQLFLQRARQVQPGFTLDTETLPHVLDICNHSAGLPLGIELAAAWVRALPVQEIAAELQRSLDLLSVGARDLPERQQSMRSTLEHSWKLLSPPEQEVLGRLAVFAGGFTRQAAAAVTGATLPLLSGLADKSLLQLTPSGRFEQHPLVHQFTREKLTQDATGLAAARAGHAQYYLQLATEARAQLRGPQQAQWLERLDVEHDNLRAALATALEQNDTSLALALASETSRYWHFRGHLSEGREWLRQVLALPEADAALPLLAEALGAAGRLAFAQSDLVASRGFLDARLNVQRSLADPDGLAAALHNLGNTLVLQGDFTAAEAHFEESLTIRRRMGDQRGTASTLHSLGNMARLQGVHAVALERYLQCLEIVTALDDQHGVAQALNGVGCAKLGQGDLVAATGFLERSLRVHRELGNLIGMAVALTNLGETARRAGDLERARLQLQESLILREQIGDGPGAASVREALAALGARQPD